MIKIERHILFVFLAIFAVVVAILVFTSAATKARTITVDDSGGKDYTKIQDAINASNAGDTIYVYDGTYNEQITISKSITMAGESNQSTTIRGSGASNSKGIYITTGNVNMSNIKVDNFEFGIHLLSGSNNNIAGNTITNCNDYGIYIDYSSNNNITSNTLTNCGIIITSTSIETTTLQDNTVNGKSLYFTKNMDSRINPTVVEDVGQVILYNSSGFIIRNNEFNNAPILLAGSSYVTITSNTLTNCGWYGIYFIYGSNNNQITSNTLTNCSRSIFLGGSNNNITSNTLTKCSDGIYVGYYTSNNSITSNVLINCGIGVSLSGSKNNTITGNTITNCSRLYYESYGVYLYSSSNNNITSNTITNCSYRGIYLHSSWNNTIISNNIYNNNYGLYRLDGSGNTAYNNWWGSASGPHNTASNPSGTGDNITDGVPFSPWATSPFGESAPVANLPSTPSITTITYTDADGNYSVNWTTTDYATSYALYENNVEVYNGALLTKTFTNKPNNNYIYKVKAWNVDGSSAYSSEVVIVVSVPGAPNRPYTPTITTIGYTDTDGNYTINWTTSSYAARYMLYENNAEIYNGTELTKTFTKPNGTYTYKIRAWNANGTSANSTQIIITVSIPAVAVNQPSTSSITTNAYIDTDGTYSINWTTSAYAVNYILEENGAVIFNGTNTTLSYSFAGKSNGTYAYRVRAWNANGTSSWSSAVTITVNQSTAQNTNTFFGLDSTSLLGGVGLSIIAIVLVVVLAVFFVARARRGRKGQDAQKSEQTSQGDASLQTEPQVEWGEPVYKPVTISCRKCTTPITITSPQRPITVTCPKCRTSGIVRK